MMTSDRKAAILAWRFGDDWERDLSGASVTDIDVPPVESCKEAWSRWVHPRATHLMDPALAYVRGERERVYWGMCEDIGALTSHLPDTCRPTGEEESWVFWSARDCAVMPFHLTKELWDYWLYPGGTAEVVLPHRNSSVTVSAGAGSVWLVNYWPWQRGGTRA